MNIKVKVKKYTFPFLLFGFGLSFTSSAQNLTSDTIRIRTIDIFANKIIPKPENAGQTATKIDSIAMRNSLTSSLSDLVSRNTPIFIKDYGRGAMATASFRGTAPSHTQVSWNGIDLNSPMLGMVDFSLIPVYFADDVSLLHGASSLKSSSGALGGTVKLENKADYSNQFSGRFITGYGSYSSFDEFVQINAGNKKIQSQSRFFYNSSKNNFRFQNKFVADIDPDTGEYSYPWQRNEHADYQNYGLLQEIYFRPTSRTFLTGRYWGQHNERSIPQLLTNETAANSNINRQNENAHRLSFDIKHYKTKSYITFNSGFNYQKSGYILKTKVSGSTDQVTVNTESEFWVWNNQFEWNSEQKWATLKAGIRANIQKVNSVNLLHNSDKDTYNTERNTINPFLNASKNFRDKYFVNLLLQGEFIDGKPKTFLPLLSAEWRPLEADFYFKASLARNSHQPTLNDLYYQPGGNPDLKSEEGFQSDFGIGGSIEKNNLSLSYSINAFTSNINNWIIWLPTFKGYWEPSNLDRVNASGFEITLGSKLTWQKIKATANANYAYTRSINHDNPQNWADESIGKQLPYIPVHSANLTANISWKHYSATWLWSYYSERFTTSSNDTESPMGVLYPYFMNNLVISRIIPIDKLKFNIELKINNLFNEEYRTVLQRPMPGRNYSVLLRLDI